jgi:uncharacterized protein (TIGR03435 family)
MRRIPAVLLLFCFSVCSVPAQPPKLEFEVASVKLGRPRRPEDGGASGGPGTSSPGHFIERNMTMRGFLGRAFGAIDNLAQISGPGWIDSEWYTIEATMPATTTTEQFRQMFQNLLLDRFKLVLRRETKQLPVYELVIAKSGHKLRPSGDVARDAPSNFPARLSIPSGGVSMGLRIESGHPVQYSVFRNQEGLGNLATHLQVYGHRTVVDKTGLKGRYDFDLYFEPVQMPDSTGLTIFDAVQQQLGLRLEDTRNPLETIVVVSGNSTPVENE